MRKSEQAVNRRIAAAFSLLLVALAGFWIGYIVKLIRSPRAPGLSVDSPLLLAQFVDVGDGDAAILSSPTGLLLLIDGGPDDNGARSILSQLQRIHRSAPKIIVLTCARARSIGGVAYLLTHCPFHGTLVLPTSPEQFAATGGSPARAVLAAAHYKRVRLVSWQQLEASSAALASLSDKNVAVTPIVVTSGGAGALAVRVDLRVGTGSGSLFYAAGLSDLEEDGLLSQRARLDCDLLAATDGGRPGSLSDEFLAETGPENVVISTSATEPADPVVLERLEGADAVVERTDQMETVTLGLTSQPGRQVVDYAPGAPLPLAIIAPDAVHNSRTRPS